MPSSYTNNLGLEKPATGEQAGTWGTTANTSYDSIDMATDGNIPITLSASSYSLNTTQGTPSDGRNKVIVWSGNLGAQATVNILPNTAKKLYLMRNSTTGGFGIAFQQGTGGNFVLQPGYAAWIFSDGAGSTARVDGLLNPQFNNILVQGALTLNMSSQANAAWDLYYRSSSGALAGFPIGSPGQLLSVVAGPALAWTSASGLQTPWLTNIDGAGHSLTNAVSIAINSATNPVSRPLYVHTTANANLVVGASGSVTGAATIETANDAWSANTPLELRCSLASFSVGFVGIQTANVPDVLTVAGIGSGGQIRMVQGNYGVMLRNDGSYFYLLLTNSGTPYGAFNSLLPFAVELATGRVNIGMTGGIYPLSVSGDVNITGTYRVNGIALGTGSPQTPWATNIDGATHSLSNVQLVSCVGLSASGPVTCNSITVGGTAGLGITVTCVGPGGSTNVVMTFKSGILTNVTFQ